jgi:hypothetical protein
MAGKSYFSRWCSRAIRSREDTKSLFLDCFLLVNLTFYELFLFTIWVFLGWRYNKLDAAPRRQLNYSRNCLPRRMLMNLP